MILAGDVGGTNARLALAEDNGSILRTEALPSHDFPSLEAAALAFLDRASIPPATIRAATFGIAGPVVNGRCEATNLPWHIDALQVAAVTRIPRVSLVNDLVALALGALTLPDDKLVSLQNGLPKKSGENLCILAAGTGLGEAGLVWNGSSFTPLGSEGGHADFAPRNELEWRLFAFLRARVGELHGTPGGGRVSYERVLSGPGIGNLYDFFRGEVGESLANDARMAGAPDRNAEVSKLAGEGASEAAARAIDLFLELYGAEAGNLALKVLATGGVYVAGGIAAHLATRFPSSKFFEAFAGKGRLSGLLAKIPVALVADTKIGLFGSAAHAAYVVNGARSLA